MREYWKEVWEEIKDILCPDANSMAALIIATGIVVFVVFAAWLIVKIFGLEGA